MRYIVDIDNTICETQGNDYENSQPLPNRILKINELYNAGHEIHYWTARGSNSGKDWLPLTLKQLTSWGCKYTSAKTGKPAYDIWIDDKAINADTYFK
jgi:hypothetical protein